jgi:hypothetical protein
MTNSGGVSQTNNGQVQAQLQSAEHYHQTNALQLAHQLRLSRISAHGHPAASDLAEYINGLNQQQAQAAYDWSSVGAAAASRHSLAALGMNQQRATMIPLTVQNRTRVLLAREQQNLVAAAQRQQQAAVMLGAPYMTSGYPHLAGQLLNHPAAAMMGHVGMHRVPMPQNQNGSVQNQASQPKSTKTTETQESVTTEKKSHQKAGEDNTNQKKEKAPKKQDSHNKRNMASPERGSKRKPTPDNNKNAADAPPEKKSRISKADSKNHTEHQSTSSSDKKNLTITEVGMEPKSSKTIIDSSTKASGDVHVKTVAIRPSELQFFVPPTPAGLSSDIAAKILAGRCHEVIDTTIDGGQASDGARVVDFILSVGTAVPIPKAMIMHRLKDRLNNPTFKNGAISTIPASSREVLTAVIMLWLWRNNENHFQRSFAKSGRIDVDTECKWFVDAAVNKAIIALSQKTTSAFSSRAHTAMAQAIHAYKSKSSVGQKSGQSGDQDPSKTSTTKIDLLAAYLVSMKLNTCFTLNEDLVSHFL